MRLLVHGESPQADVDVFDRETHFIDTVLAPVARALPGAAAWCSSTSPRRVRSSSSPRARAGVAATITPQHLLHNRNAIFLGRHQAALLLPADFEARTRSAGAARRRDQRQSALFSGHRQRTPSSAPPRRVPAAARACSRHMRRIELYAEAFESVGRLDRCRPLPAISARISTGCRATATPSP